MKKIDITFQGESYHVWDSEKMKILKSENHKFYFNKQNGLHIRCGKTETDDPMWGLPELADIEISEVCSGVGSLCKFCYKSNTPKGKNMDFKTYKRVFHNLPATITQVAFGIGDIKGNPDLFDILTYTRENGVIPNITINGAQLDKEIANFFANTLGAIAVSYYDRETTYNAIKMLTDAGMTQVNIHYVIKQDRYEEAFKLIEDIKTEPRLEKFNAVVFLSLKPKGRAKTNFDPLNKEQFDKLLKACHDSQIRYGMDSCSAMKFMSFAKDNFNDIEYKNAEQLSESCESTCFSLYINCEGKFFPCSFIEDEDFEGLDCTKPNLNFLEEIWTHPTTVAVRNKILEAKGCNKSCYKYEI